MLDNKLPQWATDVTGNHMCSMMQLSYNDYGQHDHSQLQLLAVTLYVDVGAVLRSWKMPKQQLCLSLSLIEGPFRSACIRLTTTSITSLAPPPAGHVCQLSSAVPDCLSLQDSSFLLWSRHRVPKLADFKEQNLLRWVSLTWVDFRSCCFAVVLCACTLNVNTVNLADKL